jgi:ferredoxin
VYVVKILPDGVRLAYNRDYQLLGSVCATSAEWDAALIHSLDTCAEYSVNDRVPGDALWFEVCGEAREPYRRSWIERREWGEEPKGWVGPDEETARYEFLCERFKKRFELIMTFSERGPGRQNWLGRGPWISTENSPGVAWPCRRRGLGVPSNPPSKRETDVGGWNMAERGERWEDNVQGRYYVDRACIASKCCVAEAPKNFRMVENGDHAYVVKQPETPEEEEQCRRALAGCPADAIGDDGESA